MTDHVPNADMNLDNLLDQEHVEEHSEPCNAYNCEALCNDSWDGMNHA